ncbi:MAG: hypothetical protein JNG86_13060, partial [Verrucomicrobiaceae bacterium]|nr:hypothetical protein [Verrucomicrobiaceae bacterium]
MNTRRLLLLLSMLATVLHAAPRGSTSYSVPADSADSGGRRATSVSYTNHGSAGGITGVSSVPSPSETARAGYIGQLYEVTALQLAATPATVNEGATRQLGAVQLLDDLTTIAIPAGSITWSVQSGPLSGISAAGLATAATV